MGVLYDTVAEIKQGRIPKIGRSATCRGCGAEIVWIQTASGKSMPCDATPVYYKMAAAGGQKIVTPNGVVVSCEIVTDPDNADGFGFVPHWATCSKADTFRKRGKV